MSSLINFHFLGSVFQQDTNPVWIKINGVTLGESNVYGYKTVQNKNIGQLLSSLITDSEVKVVVYNWNTGVAYVKTGFNLNVNSDSKVNSSYTSFIVKSRVWKSSLLPSMIGTPVPVATSHFVTWNYSKFQFEVNGNKFVPVGFNCFFLGLLQETNDIPSNAQITEVFNGLVKMNGTVIRSHTIGASNGSSNSLNPSYGSFNNRNWSAIDFAFSEAKRTGIKLIPVMCDVYDYYNGSIQFFTDNFNVSKADFWTNSDCINGFKNYLNTYLNHVLPAGYAIKNSPEICFIELGNELGNIRPGAESTSIPTENWLSTISSYIKSIAPNLLILDGSDESLGSSNNFNVSTLDVYSNHFYWQDYNRLTTSISNAKNVGKGVFIGEYSSQFGQDWFSTIESDGIIGSAVWSLQPHDNGLPSGNRNIHSDGFSIYCDNQTSQNSQQLLLLANHFKRMQGLSQVSSITF
jgi:mannan endo-1,4-beta-mannosidase